jgi:hypothetical protein
LRRPKLSTRKFSAWKKKKKIKESRLNCGGYRINQSNINNTYMYKEYQIPKQLRRYLIGNF